MKQVPRIVLSLLAMLPIVLAQPARAVPHELGIKTKLGEQSVAYDMNANGQVAGVMVDDAGYQHAIFYEHGNLVEIARLGGADSEARHINQRGQVIGSAATGDHRWTAYVYDKTGGTQELGTLGGRNSHGTAINDAGAAVGFADTADDTWHAFLALPGKPLQDLGTLGGNVSFASGINNRGQVVGTATDPNGYRHAFLYDAAHGMVDLGTLGGHNSYGTFINDHGVVVGASETASRRWHAFAYDGQHMKDLGALIGFGDSYATGINNAGHVVGEVETANQHFSFVWRDNRMTVAEGGPKGLYKTNAINNVEQVVGATYDRGLIAAEMFSGSPPYKDRGGSNLVMRMITVFGLACAAVILRRRYRGISISSYTGRH